MTGSVFTGNARFEPWWWEAAPLLKTAKAGVLPEVDVVVIGAGFTGLMAALVLARAGRYVLILEAGRPGEGASTRNGGMIGSGHRVAYESLKRRFGDDVAIAILTEGLCALDYTTDFIEREGIDCRFLRCGRFRGAWRPRDYEAMAREGDHLKKLVGLDIHMVPRAEQHREVATDAYHGGAVYARHGSLHPGMFHREILDRVLAAGVELIAGMPVLGIEHDGDRVTVMTSRGRVVTRDVIVATNGYTGRATPRHRRRVLPVASYVIATEPLGIDRTRRLIPGGRMIVETRSRSCYYRVSPDGERIILGGRAALRQIEPWASGVRLHRMLAGLFPELAEARISHSWLGLVGFSRDSLPRIGGSGRVYHALGYSGSGVAMAPYLGYRIAHKVLGWEEGRTALDSLPFASIPLYWGRPWFLPLLDVYYGLKDHMEHHHHTPGNRP